MRQQRLFGQMIGMASAWLLAFAGLAVVAAEDEKNAAAPPAASQPGGYTLACYYFPNYHIDPRN
ncbi:MAG: hypothetical protein HY718_01340, partial [Planctomycetes bacterium]|nr:hypothetical protein [Planctomycetota bacterium]